MALRTKAQLDMRCQIQESNQVASGIHMLRS